MRYSQKLKFRLLTVHTIICGSSCPWNSMSEKGRLSKCSCRKAVSLNAQQRWELSPLKTEDIHFQRKHTLAKAQRQGHKRDVWDSNRAILVVGGQTLIPSPKDQAKHGAEAMGRGFPMVEVWQGLYPCCMCTINWRSVRGVDCPHLRRMWSFWERKIKEGTEKRCFEKGRRQISLWAIHTGRLFTTTPSLSFKADLDSDLPLGDFPSSLPFPARYILFFFLWQILYF